MNTPPTIVSTRAALVSGQTTASETINNSVQAMNTWEPQIHALLEQFDEASKAQAERIDAEEQKRDQPLLGIPIAIKDLILTKAGHTTAGSRILKNFLSPFDATVITRLKKAGAVIIGKANQDEFGMGSSNEYSAFGPTKNPWDVGRVPGGSSGGSAAAVASGEVLCALGTDTGGSVRLPASFCGVVGLKPTYGRVSRFGMIAYGSSFDQIGPLARTVADTATLLQVIAGHDSWDATSSDESVPNYQSFCGKSIVGLKIGVPREFMSDAIDPAVKQVIQSALSDLAEQGAIISEVSLSLMEYAIPTYYVLAKSEASSNLARFDGLRYNRPSNDQENMQLLEHYQTVRGSLFGPEVKRSILMGTYALSAGYADAWYKQASRVRTLIRREFADIFKQVDVIAGPVSPEVAFPLQSKTSDPLKMYLVDMYTVAAPVAGLPAISVPCGFVYPERSRRAQGLPVGLQLMAPAFREDLLFQVGHAYEQAHEWWKAVPSLQ